jgi:putative acyl-CoA dehydrogenase
LFKKTNNSVLNGDNMQPFDTHEVRNTVAPFGNINLFAADPALQEALQREGAGDAAASLQALGEELGKAEALDLARLANLHTPKLHNYDREGHRIDEVEFHPSWHKLMGLLIGHGTHSSPWQGGPGAQVARAARYLLFGQPRVLPPSGCPRSCPTITTRVRSRSSKRPAPSSAWA